MVAVIHSYIALSFSGIDKLWTLPLWSVEASDALFAKLILIFSNGTSAVTIFFVLSGVVLGLSLDADAHSFPKKYTAFLIKRIFRIYPAHLFVLLGICVLLFFSGWQNPGTFERASLWYNWYYRGPPDAHAVLENALLFQWFLNPVTWTLAVEMAVALVFPILHAASRLPYRPAIVQSAILIILIATPALFPQNKVLLPHLYKFYVGLLLPVYGITIAEWFTKHLAFVRLSSGIPFLLALAALLIEPELVRMEAIDPISQTIGAALLIYLLTHRNAGWLFHLHAIKKLGQYSYSFYLLHFPILWFGYYMLHSLPAGEALILRYALPVSTAMCLITIAIAYLFAALNYRLIEKPFILIGRHLAKRVSDSAENSPRRV